MNKDRFGDNSAGTGRDHFEWEITCGLIWGTVKIILWLAGYCCAAILGLLFSGYGGAFLAILGVTLVYGLTRPDDSSDL